MIDAGRLRTLPFFDGLPEPVVAALAAQGDERELAAGELVIEQNDEALAVWFLVEGSVQLLLRYDGVGDLSWGRSRSPARSSAGPPCARPTATPTRSGASSPVACCACPVPASRPVMAEDPQVGFLLLQRVTGEVARTAGDHPGTARRA
jgi:hypothetical protein